MNASLFLIQHQLEVLNSTEHHVEVLQASTSLILFSISRLNSLCPDNEKSHKGEKIKMVFGELKTNFWKWIASSSVIGGSVFGGDVNYWNWKGPIELKVSSTHSNHNCGNH